jgi:hypothetical protein
MTTVMMMTWTTRTRRMIWMRVTRRKTARKLMTMRSRIWRAMEVPRKGMLRHQPPRVGVRPGLLLLPMLPPPVVMQRTMSRGAVDAGGPAMPCACSRI